MEMYLLNKIIKEGDKYIFYSKQEDLFLKESVEEYLLTNEEGILYISKISKSNLSSSPVFKEAVEELYTMRNINYNSIELNQMSSRLKVQIRENGKLTGKYKNGIEFDYTNIFKVVKS
ncbi:MAG: hypothetical protein N4A40_12645 [Tissierellales bacterium]|nr:hypothetical protein [Tissierellales bacterium]